jgi:hypothetical protein
MKTDSQAATSRFYRIGYVLFLILFGALSGLFAQSLVPPKDRIESRQGYPGATDVIAHKVVSKDTHARCTQVEHHPKSDDDGAACLLRLANGGKFVLKFGQTKEIPVDGEIFLECLGDKPTKCSLGLY